MQSMIYDGADNAGGVDLSSSDAILRSPGGKIGLMRDMALGLEYLHSANVIFRDLAARNCVLSLAGTVRIGEYGNRLANFGDDYSTLSGVATGGKARYPVRWMAPETLADQSEWNSATDVWSWAVTAWEIASLGNRPHAEVGDRAIVAHIQSGAKLPTARLEIPENITRTIMRAMNVDAAARPSAAEVAALLAVSAKRIVGSAAEHSPKPPADPNTSEDAVYEIGPSLTASAPSSLHGNSMMYDVPASQQLTANELESVEEVAFDQARVEHGAIPSVKEEASEVYASPDDLGASDATFINHGSDGQGFALPKDHESPEDLNSAQSQTATSSNTLVSPTVSATPTSPTSPGSYYEYAESFSSKSADDTYATPEPLLEPLAAMTPPPTANQSGNPVNIATYATPEALGESTYEVPSAYHEGSSVGLSNVATDNIDNATYEIPEPFQGDDNYAEVDPEQHTRHGGPSMHRIVSKNVATTAGAPGSHVAPAELAYDNDAGLVRGKSDNFHYDNNVACASRSVPEPPEVAPRGLERLDLFDESVPVHAAAAVAELDQPKMEAEDDIDSSALDHLLAQYGGSPAAIPAPVPDPASAGDEEMQPVQITIETLTGASTAGKGAGPKEATTNDSKPGGELVEYTEALACEPKWYTKKIGKQSLTVKLRAACKRGHYKAVENILTYPTDQYDINGARKGGSGKTSLHIAAEKGYLRILDMLIQKNANLFCRDNSQKLPIDYASQKRFAKVTAALKAAMITQGKALLGNTDMNGKDSSKE